MSVPRVPEKLYRSLRIGSCIAFVGAGLSQGAGLPNWLQLLELMLEWSFNNETITKKEREELSKHLYYGELLLVASRLRDRSDNEAFREFMVSIFRQDHSIKITKSHKILTKIPFRAVITTNYDKLIEASYAHHVAPLTFTYQQTPELSAALHDKEFYILKAHGTIDDIQSIVLGETEYRKIINDFPAYKSYIMNILSGNTLLFLGFSLRDPDLLTFLNEFRSHFNHHTGLHFALVPDASSVQVEHYLKEYGIHLLSYSPSREHLEVQVFLEGLEENLKDMPINNAYTIYHAPTNRFSNNSNISLTSFRHLMIKKFK